MSSFGGLDVDDGSGGITNFIIYYSKIFGEYLGNTWVGVLAKIRKSLCNGLCYETASGEICRR